MSQEAPFEGQPRKDGIPEQKTKAERDFAFQKDMVNTRHQVALHEGNAFAESHAEALLREAKFMLEQLHADSVAGKLLLKDDVDKITMNLESCVAISGSEDARLLLASFVAEYPDAGTKKH